MASLHHNGLYYYVRPNALSESFKPYRVVEMKLTDHIKEQHSNNISAFARTQGVRRDQVSRWIKRGCLVIDGKVYCEVNNKVNK